VNPCSETVPVVTASDIRLDNYARVADQPEGGQPSPYKALVGTNPEARVCGCFPKEIRFERKSDIATRDHFVCFTFRL
jgi:hypothetical protein